MKHVGTAVLLATLFGAAASPGLAQDSETKNILVFGDSLTWGWVPTSPVVPTTRHAPEDRWTAAMAETLGDDYSIVVEGLSARTTNIDDPTDDILNGSEYLPAALMSHDPLDLVIIMLGTNDTKTYLDRTPLEIGLGAGELINIVHESPWAFTENPAPRVLLISPPPLGDEIGVEAREAFDETSKEKSAALAEIYAKVADLAGEYSFAAGSVIETDGVDGIHFTAQSNRVLGEAVAAEVQSIFGGLTQ
ncbi:SGNH/GDSL hydrolase family protein [Amaricoccus macauensis]|uniref:SGNH/GDSL hydrolase family protein n=1 Tax=Amaricoccus macauensis TaxID=57001 RepID=UPI003C7C4137